MSVLSSTVGTPYIGSIRVQIAGAGGNESVEVPYSDRRASLGGFTPGGGYTITVQAVTGGTVIMEKILQGVTLPEDQGLDLDVNLIESGGFSYAGSLLYKRLQHSAVLYSSGVLVLGGNLSTGVMESIGFSGEGFSISAFADSLIYPRTGQKAFLNSRGDEVLVFLGSPGQDSIYEVIDLVDLSCITNSIGTIRTGYFPAHFGSDIYLTSGYNENSIWLANTLKLNTSSYNEAIITSMGIFTEQTNTECITVQDKLACLGGNVSGAYTGTIEIFDIGLETPITQRSLSSPRSNFAITEIPNNRILITGGIGDSGISRDVEILDFNNYQVTTYPNALKQDRVNHAGTLLFDGRVLLVGGGITPQALTSAEIIDPDTGVSVELPWLLRIPRYNHTITRLSDGRVLVVGGNNVDTTIEVFNPN
ncbi:MAG: kelch repeat-containing protein [bacterium]